MRAKEALTRLQMEKRLAPYLRTTRANPAGHFWFIKIPAGRYYLVSLIEEESGPYKEEQLSGLAWLVLELDANGKLTNLSSDRLQNQPLLSLPSSKTSL